MQIEAGDVIPHYLMKVKYDGPSRDDTGLPTQSVKMLCILEIAASAVHNVAALCE